MTPYYQTPAGEVAVYHGDALAVLAEMADASVHCCVTSPPYWGLRDYGVEGQIGLEPTPEAYVARIVEVFAQVRRVLRDDGTCWVNLGDSYAVRWGSKRNEGRGGFADNERTRGGKVPANCREKNLIGVPWRVAFALQANGWYLRRDIVWHKPNPMPESVTDRPTTAHEYVFLFAKSERYWYDAKAIAEPVTRGHRGSLFQTVRRLATKPDVGTKPREEHDTRNARSVWTIAMQPFTEAHFAVMAPELARRCVVAGCPAGGVVLDPFSGSGTTLAVAVERARRGVGVELNTKYCAIAASRLDALTRQTSIFSSIPKREVK